MFCLENKNWRLPCLGAGEGFALKYRSGSHGKIVGAAWVYHKVLSSSESAFEFCVKNF